MAIRLTGFIFIILFVAFIFGLGFLFFTRQVYIRTTSEDVNCLSEYLASVYLTCPEEVFLQEIWLKRPSLLALKLEQGKEILLHSYRTSTYKLFQKSFPRMPLTLQTGEQVYLTLIYTLLPKQELFYCCAVSLSVLLSLLFLLFCVLWRIS